MLDAYLDNELNAQTSAGITVRLAECKPCASQHVALDKLRLCLRDSAPYHRGRPGWATTCVMASAAAMLRLLTGLWLARPVADDPMHEQVAATHVASLDVNGRLLEVAASDQHVVKPWFQGKIDFAPTVRNFTSDGFTLAGARLDHVGDRQVAALVYRIRHHVINVFIWRASTHESMPPATRVARGYRVTAWASGGLRYTAISDVDSRDLQRLAALMLAASH